jgi:ribosomal protein S18 acetylase RimI-like enzyme
MGSGVDVGRWTSDRLRVGPWRGDARTAYLAPLGDGRELQPADIEGLLPRLSGAGYRRAITAAISPAGARAFLLAGFEVHERLHLLARSLHALPAVPAAHLRRARRRDHARVLEVDRAAFQPFWQLDEAGLEEAIDATPSSRFRVAVDATDGTIIGYGVSGRAGRRGFVQRLAVEPDRHGNGTGQALVLDGLHWMRRRGVDRVVVNTQESNERALHLYLRLGFEDQPGGLAVLERSL